MVTARSELHKTLKLPTGKTSTPRRLYKCGEWCRRHPPKTATPESREIMENQQIKSICLTNMGKYGDLIGRWDLLEVSAVKTKSLRSRIYHFQCIWIATHFETQTCSSGGSSSWKHFLRESPIKNRLAAQAKPLHYLLVLTWLWVVQYVSHTLSNASQRCWLKEMSFLNQHIIWSWPSF